MQDLPYEIWRLIADYLPAKKIRTLYSVNRAFLSLALDLRYEVACLSADPNNVGRDIELFQNPLLISRPKTLRIQMSSLRNGERARAQPLSFFKRLTAHKSNVERVVKRALKLMCQMTKVARLDILYEADDPPCHDTITPLLFPRVLEIFGSQLRFLRIDSPYENLATLLPASVQLPCLDTFAIDSSAFYHSTAVNYITVKVLTPFLSIHGPTLRDVSFITRKYSLDISFILRALGEVPRLDHICIHVPFQSMSRTPFAGQRMLMAHQQHLESLSLSFPSTSAYKAVTISSFFSKEWCLVKLPKLKALTIQPPSNLWYDQPFLDYIRQFASSLVSLEVLYNRNLIYDEVKKIGSMFSDFKCLQNLVLGVYGLSPDVFGRLALVLPNLISLYLDYSYISPRNDERSAGIELCIAFDQNMAAHSRVFSRWALESLDYYPRRIDSDGRIEKAFVDNLPHVMWFCAMEREEYIQQMRLLLPIPTEVVLGFESLDFHIAS